MNNKFLAIITARGGSKRLPKKNILDLNGKPLISWTIEAAKSCKYIDEVTVSSDSEEILNIAKELNSSTIKRPDILASDIATSFDVVKHAIEYYKQKGKDYKYIILLQPTSPLRDFRNIEEAIELLEKKAAKNIVSVCECEHSPLWSNTLNSSLSMDNFLDKKLINKRSQDLEIFYRLNGAIYICEVEEFLKQESFIFEENSYAYIMPTEKSVDIDNKIDFELASILMKDF